MSTPLLVILAAGAALGCWVALTLMGGERSRRMHHLQAQRPVPETVKNLSVTANAVGVAETAARKPKHAKASAAGKNSH